MRRGLSDEINDRNYLIVDGVDGRTHYVKIGKGDATDPVPEGAIIDVTPKRAEPRVVDRSIAADRRGEWWALTVSISTCSMTRQPVSPC